MSGETSKEITPLTWVEKVRLWAGSFMGAQVKPVVVDEERLSLPRLLEELKVKMGELSESHSLNDAHSVYLQARLINFKYLCEYACGGSRFREDNNLLGQVNDILGKANELILETAQKYGDDNSSQSYDILKERMQETVSEMKDPAATFARDRI